MLRERFEQRSREGATANTSHSHNIGSILENAIALADLDPDDDLAQSRSDSNPSLAATQGRPTATSPLQ